MHSFSFHLTTEILFGPDQGAVFAEAVARRSRRLLVMSGSGAVVRHGQLGEVVRHLERAGGLTVSFTGVEPNPDASTVNRAALLARSERCDGVVAVGGGSTMDAAKAAAALAATGAEADIWPFMMGGPRAGTLREALPVYCVPTTAATASEVTAYAVISNRAEAGKSVLAHDFLKPRAAWLNPRFTVGLPAIPTADGAADILSHVFENYLLGGDASPLADHHAEGVVTTVLETLPRLQDAPADETLRGRMLWASTLALSGLECAGRAGSGFPLHAIEHAMSAVRPELAHGRGLATLFPAYFRWLLEHSRAVRRFARLGARVYQLAGDEWAQAGGFVVNFERWLQARGLRQSARSLGFDYADFERIADYAVIIYGNGYTLEALGPVTRDDIIALLTDTERQDRQL